MTAAKNHLTVDRMREVFSYCPDSGELRWRVAKRNGIRVGDLAGAIQNGYIYVGVDRRLIFAHRIAWAIHYGEWPKASIDHIDGNRQNNRITNLRDVDNQGNMRNRRAASGAVPFLGVSKSGSRFVANIGIGGRKMICLGRRDTPEEAYELYKAAKLKYHGVKL